MALTQVFFRTPYLTVTPLLVILFSKPLRTLYFPFNVLRFPAINEFKFVQQTKNKQMIEYSNVRINNINKSKCLNVRTLKNKCNCHKFVNLARRLKNKHLRHEFLDRRGIVNNLTQIVRTEIPYKKLSCLYAKNGTQHCENF